MIMIDTNIWIDHFRSANPRITLLVANEAVWQHPFVTGELAVGDLADRARTLLLLQSLPQVVIAEEQAIYDIVVEMKLVGTGLGFVDVHVLTALQHTPGLRLWTRDQRLADQADRLGQNYQPA